MSSSITHGKLAALLFATWLASTVTAVAVITYAPSFVPLPIQKPKIVYAQATANDYIHFPSDIEYSDIPQMNVTIRTYEKSTFMIAFSSYRFSQSSAEFFVSAVVDDKVVSAIQPSNDPGLGFTYETFNFVARDIPAGQHTVKIQWNPLPNSSSDGWVMKDRTLNVIGFAEP